jgi:hypothetical protein
MKRIMYLFTMAAGLVSGCHGREGAPDVSEIKIDLTIERFDKDLFALDSTQLPLEFPRLEQKYPSFAHIFAREVLNLGASADTPEAVVKELRHFLAQNQVLKDSVFKKFASVTDIRSGLTDCFRYVKYYFPDYPVPAIITFIGNFGGSVAYTKDGLAIGLDEYMGSSFSYYQIPEIQEVYPSYLTRKFSPEYIPVNCMSVIIGDIYPTDNTDTLPLIDQIIDHGKRLYILGLLVPDASDTLKLGYTGQQYAWCKTNEGLIWNFMVEQNVLYTFDPDVIKNFLSDAPTTQGMPDASPGNIASYIGLQMVRKYVARQSGKMTPKELMEIPVKTILTEAQYNPK